VVSSSSHVNFGDLDSLATFVLVLELEVEESTENFEEFEGGEEGGEDSCKFGSAYVNADLKILLGHFLKRDS
jgi:hypothetical protein